MKINHFVKTGILGSALIFATFTTLKAQDKRDRIEDRFDKLEDRYDRKENQLDRAENKRDRREDVTRSERRSS